MVGKFYIIGIDLGGTYTRAALYDGRRFIEKLEEKTKCNSPESLHSQLIDICALLCKRSAIKTNEIKGVSIASKGPIDIKKGELANPTDFPFKRAPLVKPIEKELNVPVYLTNDCTAAVIGEHEFGAGRGLDNIVHITIGTGIGGGVYVDGHVLFGKDGNAAEIGHLTIDYEGNLKCGCGKRGHWEAYCSGKNIPKFVKWRIMQKLPVKSLLFKISGKNLSKLKSEDLFEAAKVGDRLSVELVDEIGRLNAIGFASINDAYDPSLITVGGSVALQNGGLIINPIKKYLKVHARNKPPKIMLTPLGKEIGLYGAVAAIFRKFSRNSVVEII